MAVASTPACPGAGADSPPISPVGDVELQRGFEGGGTAGRWAGRPTAIGSKLPPTVDLSHQAENVRLQLYQTPPFPVGDVELQRGFESVGTAGRWAGRPTAIGSKPPPTVDLSQQAESVRLQLYQTPPFPVGDVELQRGFESGGTAGRWAGRPTAIGSKPPPTVDLSQQAESVRLQLYQTPPFPVGDVEL